LLSHAPQPCTISAFLAIPPRPTQPYKISALLGHASKTCSTGDTNMHDLHSAGPCPQGLHSPVQSLLCWATPLRPAAWRYKQACSPFHLAMPPRPAQPCTIFTPQACAPKACQAGDPHTHDSFSAGPCPPSLSSWGSTDIRLSTPLACTLQACQAHAPKAHYFTSAKVLHP
jgi:hypothetical protein